MSNKNTDIQENEVPNLKDNETHKAQLPEETIVFSVVDLQIGGIKRYQIKVNGTVRVIEMYETLKDFIKNLQTIEVESQ